MSFPILTIVSGGQTGADLAALEAATSLFPSHRTAGYMPKGFDTELGPRPDIADKYGLQESHGGYADRDKQNVDISDGLPSFSPSRKPAEVPPVPSDMLSLVNMNFCQLASRRIPNMLHFYLAPSPC